MGFKFIPYAWMQPLFPSMSFAVLRLRKNLVVVFAEGCANPCCSSELFLDGPCADQKGQTMEDFEAMAAARESRDLP